MAARKPFLLRVEPGLLAALERWAADDLRSVNGQIEFLLRDALRRAGRKVVAAPADAAVETTDPGDDEPAAAPAAPAADAPASKRRRP